MKDIDLEAFRPVPFPEIGPDETFNANFCRNPMCPNFGPAPDPDDYADRYSVVRDDTIKTDRRYVCRTCKSSSRLLSNESLHAAYVWFKRQSIPFATCPAEGCGNAGVNVFEHWGPARYWYDNENRSDVVRCVKCGTRFSIGQALGLHGDRADPKGMERRLAAIFKHVRLGVGLRTSIALLEDPAVGEPFYLRAVERLSRKMLDYQGCCNAALMARAYPDRLRRLFRNAHDGEEPGPADSPFNGTATLRTDAMSVSLRTPTSYYERRHHPLAVMVTVLRIHEPATWFLLAAHPCAVFQDEDMPPRRDKPELVRDGTRPVARRRFDHLYHFGTAYPRTDGRKRAANRKRRRIRDATYFGAGGQFMRREYAELAHYMVVRELTRRFTQVTLCMDGDKTAYKSAAAVFATDMRKPLDKAPSARRFEMAVVQTQDGAGSDGDRTQAWERQKKRVQRRWSDKLREQRKEAGLDSWAEDPEALAKAKARLFLTAMRGGFSKIGEWGWMIFPPRPGVWTRLLWLSQGPDRGWPPEGDVEMFLRYANLQSVDSAIQAMRRRAPAARRPRFRANSSASYSESSMSVKAATHGIWLSWFAFNYDRPWCDRELMPARILGLMRPEDRAGFNIARRVRVRLGWEHAREITRRIGNG